MNRLNDEAGVQSSMIRRFDRDSSVFADMSASVEVARNQHFDRNCPGAFAEDCEARPATPLPIVGFFIVLMAAMLATPALRAAEADPVATTRLYVSVGGNDRWSGRLPAPAADGQDGPFATLVAARNAVRKQKAANALSSPVVVMILEGTYSLSEPFVLTLEDSGTQQHPVTYTAYPGHHPVISGGRAVGDWQPHSGKIVKTDLEDVAAGRWRFRQLFYRGERQMRAHWPNRDPKDPLYSGWAFIEPPAAGASMPPRSYRYFADQPAKQWARPDQGEMNIFPWYCWVNDLIPVAAAAHASRTVTLGRIPHFDFMPVLPGNRFCVENMLEELDQPGEWSLETDTGTLYFWPPGELKSEDVVVPVIETLVEINGTGESPVHHVTISGLTFSHTQATFPDHQHSSHHSPGLRGAGITLSHCAHCRIEDNRFTQLGNEAVRLQGANSENKVIGNEIEDIGGAGVVLTSLGEMNADTWTDPAAMKKHSAGYPKLVRNIVSDNVIQRCGRIKKNCGGVQLFAINSVDNVIAHNRIQDLSDKGMVMQDGYGRFMVEYNDMNQLGQEIADTGGIMINRWFTLADDPDLSQGSIIRFNRIRKCIGCGAYSEIRHPKGEGDRTTANGRINTPYYCWGIYFDNSGMNNLVFGNIVASTVLGGVALPVGAPKNNRVENNIFLNSSANQFDLRMEGENNRFRRNIVSYADPNAMLLAANGSTKNSVVECDHNLYFLRADIEPRVRGIGTLSDWKKLGFDQHSLVADPLFQDITLEDYRLRPESPAYRLGFQPIPVDDIGPRVRTVGAQRHK